jgi:DNA repair protein RadD
MKVVNPEVRVVGLTATPFRLKGGLICKPENILNEVCYEAGLKEMIEQGFLSPIVARAGNIEADFSKLHIKGGEFVAKEVEKLMDMPEITNAACEEIVELTKDRKTVLIFCTSVAHSKHVANKITELTGCECAIVTGDTPAQERADVIERLRGNSVKTDLLEEPKPPLKYCANVAVMTTGLDIPNIDCVVMLRPTASPGLLLQIAGRGLRLAPNKTECVFLDFGGNILRHGPLDMIKEKLENKKPYKGRPKGDCTAKTCPECSALIYAILEVCPYCGYEFPMDKTPKIQMHASTLDVISKDSIFNEYEVKSVSYEVHEKRFSSPEDPKTMRVDYDLGNFVYKSEWVCPEHGGYAGEKFGKWWKERAALGCPTPVNAQEAVELANAGALMTPRKIIVKTTTGEKFDRIIRSILPTEKPVWSKVNEYPKEWDEVITQAPSAYSVDDQIPF